MGTPISEVGIITLETEVSSIEGAGVFSTTFRKDKYRFLYVAHRRDSDENLKN